MKNLLLILLIAFPIDSYAATICHGFRPALCHKCDGMDCGPWDEKIEECHDHYTKQCGDEGFYWKDATVSKMVQDNKL